MALSDKTFVPGVAEAGISSTKLRAEQVKTELGQASLAGDLFALSKQIEDIIGDANWKADVSGLDVQLVDLSAHIGADKSATEMEIKQDLLVSGDQHFEGAAQFDDTLTVDGEATLASAIVEDLIAAVGAIVIHDGAGALQDSADFKFDGSHIYAPGAKISGLTQHQVVVPGAAGVLGGSAALTFNGTELYVNGALDVSGNADIGGNLTVQGNFVVEGDTVTQNVTTVTTEDSVITLNRNAQSIPVAGAGIFP